jgi:hypothetical protein
MKPLNLHSFYQHGGSTTLIRSLRKGLLSINNIGAHVKLYNIIYHKKQGIQGTKNKQYSQCVHIASFI